MGRGFAQIYGSIYEREQVTEKSIKKPAEKAGFSPQMLNKWEYRDTLEIDEDCFFKRFIVQARLDTNFFGGVSNCDVQIKAESAFEGKREVVIVSAPFPEQLVVQIEGKPENIPVEIELIDVLGTEIQYIESN